MTGLHLIISIYTYSFPKIILSSTAKYLTVFNWVYFHSLLYHYLYFMHISLGRFHHQECTHVREHLTPFNNTPKIPLHNIGVKNMQNNKHTTSIINLSPLVPTGVHLSHLQWCGWWRLLPPTAVSEFPVDRDDYFRSRCLLRYLIPLLSMLWHIVCHRLFESVLNFRQLQHQNYDAVSIKIQIESNFVFSLVLPGLYYPSLKTIHLTSWT